MCASAGRRWVRGLLALAVIGGALVACSGSGGSGGGDAARPTAPTARELARSGGEHGSVDNAGRTAFAQGMAALDRQGRRDFAVGNSFFTQNWVIAPSSTTGRDGLGPIFNAQACASCHFQDGRAQPPTSDDDPERGLLVRLSSVGEDGEPGPHPIYGSQFQDRAIRGIDPEGSVHIDIAEQPGAYPDGTEYSLGAPTYTLRDAQGNVIEDILVSPRIAPAMMGVGLLENIPAATIEAQADPGDADGDGISGRVNHVVDQDSAETVIGRFGWKAATPTVRAQTVDAALNDIGLTSEERPDGPCTPAQTECLAKPDGGVPEIDRDKVDKITFYSRTLAVPERRHVGAPETDAGARSFEAIGCASCHTPEVRTGGDSEIAALNDQVIRPYTDLLVHDMGEGLADHRPDGEATGTEWRTPPLWGIGLVETVNGHTRFLHDGRARNLEEAILWHGGEAAAVRDRFMALRDRDRRAILTFLESL